jgi:hypothetical protein
VNWLAREQIDDGHDQHWSILVDGHPPRGHRPWASTYLSSSASKVREGAMRSEQVAESPKTFVVILDTGDEILSSLQSVARTEKLAGSSFKAIGALSDVELGWFNWETKKYQTAVKLQEQVELLSLIGDIALKENEPQIHAHLVIGRQDGTAHGGHLLSATVRPTCEIVITERPQHLQKEIDPDSGIALIRL